MASRARSAETDHTSVDGLSRSVLLFARGPAGIRPLPSDVHCRSDLRVIHVRRPGPVEEQHLFSFVAIHEAFLMLLSELTVCLRRALSWAIPREILDFTVPNGTSRMAATSSYE